MFIVECSTFHDGYFSYFYHANCYTCLTNLGVPDFNCVCLCERETESMFIRFCVLQFTSINLL